MGTEFNDEQESSTPQAQRSSPGLGLAIALAALAAIGAGIAIQQLLERRLSRPELERLKFYRYLREKGRLES